MLRTLVLSLSVLLAACGGQSSDASAGASGDGATKRVAVVPKGMTHTFWLAVKAGAERGAKAAGLEMTFKGPLSESDRAGQIAMVQQFVSEGVAGIALAPLDHTALAPVVASAKQKGIPVVIFDSALDGTPGADFASFVATDNEKAGEMAGEALAKALGDGGKKVVLLRYQVGSASTEAREKGFLTAAKAAGLEVIVDNRYAGGTAGEAKTTSLNMADALRDCDGIFASNESATNGMLLALEQLGLAGKKRFVGFDSSPPLNAGLEAGKIDALVVQDPQRMGELAVEQLQQLIGGKTVPAVTDTGAVLATKANMQQPEIARLLK
ncbi:MAG: substrate-binding domain-containing protein [Planctomycetota bacterium]